MIISVLTTQNYADSLKYVFLLCFELVMSSANSPKKVILPLPFPKKSSEEEEGKQEHDHFRPKPQRYADRTFMPPPGTRRSMGKR